MSEQLRRLPSVSRLLDEPGIMVLVAEHSHTIIVEVIREVLDEARERIARGEPVPTVEGLAEAVRQRTQNRWQASLVSLINATGVIIHTNLGRAPLAEEAIQAMAGVSRGYSNLEFNLEAGERGSRHVHVERLLCDLTGAEAAIAVNNNAGAVLLALSALAQGKEVTISRGEAVEIGGGFRIPDVLRQSGARLVEVGTTNRTYVSDYEAAISPETALLLKVHWSNFRIVGFVHQTTLAELVALGQRHSLPVIEDLGSGALLDTTAFGLAHEPQVQEGVAAGAALVCFSGDKLLGGPQAGLIVGKREVIEQLKRHPLARALRIDKLSLAALEATLLLYARGRALQRVPVWQMISAPLPALERRARRWAATLRGWGVHAHVEGGDSTVGGGSLPGEALPTRLLAIQPASLVPSVEQLASRLRQGAPPIVGRIERDTLLLDPRTVLPGQDRALLDGLRAALRTPEAGA